MTLSRIIRVLLVDDHEMVALSLNLMFGEIEDIELVGRAGDGTEALSLVAELRPDVVLMDLMMPLMDGFQTTALVREQHPQVKVIVLSASSLQQDIDAATRAGAHAYISKDSSNSTIINAIRGIIR
jgi:two-component system, NarL family, response regulator LiaR